MDPFRRAEIDERHALIARILESTRADQLLLRDPANIHWLAGAALARAILDPSESPCLIVSSSQRWLVASNIDSQRLFDLDLDGLGFQLKEWPWHADREQLLTDLCLNRVLACDQPFRDSANVAGELHRARQVLSPLAQEALRRLGRDLTHALEATCRNIDVGSAEWEAAGHVAHRLYHRGIEPVSIQIAADRRLTKDRRPTYSSRPIEKYCTVIAAVRRDGLHAMASRMVSFGPVEDELRREVEVAGSIATARLAALRLGATPKEIFDAGQKVASVLGAENEWRESPMAWLTGWKPVESLLPPTSSQSLANGNAVVLQSLIGATEFVGTFMIGDSSATDVSAAEEWPVRRYKLMDRFIELPDVLQR